MTSVGRRMRPTNTSPDVRVRGTQPSTNPRLIATAMPASSPRFILPSMNSGSTGRRPSWKLAIILFIRTALYAPRITRNSSLAMEGESPNTGHACTTAFPPRMDSTDDESTYRTSCLGNRVPFDRLPSVQIGLPLTTERPDHTCLKPDGPAIPAREKQRCLPAKL